MRKPIPKSVRKLVYAKYDGHCAYCGCKIPEKGFNVDHLYCLRNYEYTEDFTGIDVHDIKNFMPACGSCNRYKATMNLEEFRKQLQKIPDRLARDVCTYNIAVRYGMVQENREPIKFYFEKIEETGILQIQNGADATLEGDTINVTGRPTEITQNLISIRKGR